MFIMGNKHDYIFLWRKISNLLYQAVSRPPFGLGVVVSLLFKFLYQASILEETVQNKGQPVRETQRSTSQQYKIGFLFLFCSDNLLWASIVMEETCIQKVKEAEA